MELSTILDFVQIQAQTKMGGDAGIIFANEALQDFHRRLIAAGVDASQLQESYTDGTANQGTYLYPTNMIFLKAIELNYNSTQADGYTKAEQVDVSNLSGYGFGWLRTNADKNTPQFDDRGDWYEIFPTPTSADNLTALIRIFYYLKPTEYTATSDTVAYPENLDAATLGWRIAAMYYYSLNKMTEGDMFNLKYEERVDQYIKTLGRGVQTPTQTTPLQIDGWQY